MSADLVCYYLYDVINIYNKLYRFSSYNYPNELRVVYSAHSFCSECSFSSVLLHVCCQRVNITSRLEIISVSLRLHVGRGKECQFLPRYR